MPVGPEWLHEVKTAARREANREPRRMGCLLLRHPLRCCRVWPRMPQAPRASGSTGLAYAAVPGFVARGGGTIINISSIVRAAALAPASAGSAIFSPPLAAPMSAASAVIAGCIPEIRALFSETPGSSCPARRRAHRLADQVAGAACCGRGTPEPSTRPHRQEMYEARSRCYRKLVQCVTIENQ
jgi:hypothetical protein